jgi:SAM-dependent methyltransferase
MKEAFSDVYGRDDWNGGSGRGSTPENTVEYRKVIEDFLRTHEIKRVVDIGCGDWQFSRLIDWGKTEYIGIDTVPAVIEANRQRFGSRYQFECLDVSCDTLPPGDLVLMKDVLQHWPNDIILSFLPRLEQYRFAILTNCGNSSPDLNTDIAMTGYRPLDLRQAPFNYASEELLRYRSDEVPQGQWNKLVLLHRSF